MIASEDQDLILECTIDGTQFKVNSEKLVSQSKYFETCLSSSFQESKTRLIKFDDITSEELRTILNFIDFGSFKISNGAILTYAKLANRLTLESLSEQIAKLVFQKLVHLPKHIILELSRLPCDTIHEAIQQKIFYIARDNMQLAYKFCLIIDESLFVDIIKDDSCCLTEELIFKVVLSFKRNVKKFRRLCKYVRFPIVPAEDFEQYSRAYLAPIGIDFAYNKDSFDNFLTKFDEESFVHRGNPFRRVGLLKFSRGNKFWSFKQLSSSHWEKAWELSAPLECSRFRVDSHVFFGDRIIIFSSSQLISLRLSESKRCTYTILCRTGELNPVGISIFKGGVLVAAKSNEDESRMKLHLRLYKFVSNSQLNFVGVIPTNARFSQMDVHKCLVDQDDVFLLSEEHKLFKYSLSSGKLCEIVSPTISGNSKYVDFILHLDLLIALDYYSPPIEEHDFSQPFSRFDKIRKFNRFTLELVETVDVCLNNYRKNCNELFLPTIQLFICCNVIFLLYTSSDYKVFECGAEGAILKHREDLADEDTVAWVAPMFMAGPDSGLTLIESHIANIFERKSFKNDLPELIDLNNRIKKFL